MVFYFFNIYFAEMLQRCNSSFCVLYGGWVVVMDMGCSGGLGMGDV